MESKTFRIIVGSRLFLRDPCKIVRKHNLLVICVPIRFAYLTDVWWLRLLADCLCFSQTRKLHGLWLGGPSDNAGNQSSEESIFADPGETNRLTLNAWITTLKRIRCLSLGQA